METRVEKDFIGEIEIPAGALYGIQSLRAKQNFPFVAAFPREWYMAMGMVKLACYVTYKKFSEAVVKKYGNSSELISLIPAQILEAMVGAAEEIKQGLHFDHFIVSAISGGAGTSINMNINEIIANRALVKLGLHPGNYDIIDPIERANIFQSTNDVVPTALKVALLKMLAELETTINQSRSHFETLEKEHRNSMRIGYTQMQEAVPTTFGRLFSTYNEALSRDWWRVSKAWERIKVVNLGGSAIGTGITAPRFFIAEVVQNLQEITGLPVTKAENLSDATSNLDSLVEMHAILKAHAVNLEKIASDIRLLASDLAKEKTVAIPKMQIGSTIMPGKVNPVISEFIISASHKIYSNDMLISSLAGQGCLELNAYLPVIGTALIESLRLMVAANQTLQQNMLKGLVVNEKAAWESMLKSPSVTTALVPFCGYKAAAILAGTMKENNLDIFEANKKINLLDAEKLEQILCPSFLLKEGFTLDDLKNMKDQLFTNNNTDS